MARILVDGSSTAYGLWDTTGGGFANRLKTSLIADQDRRKFGSVINLAAPLRTVIDIADDLPQNAERYQGNSPARIGLFMLGMSESRLIEGKQAVPPETFRRSLGRVGAVCASFGYAPIFLGMPPIDETRTHNFGRENAHYTEEQRAIYEEMISDYALQEDATYINISAQLALRHPDIALLMDEDGLHMNDVGHAAIHDIMSPVVLGKIAELKTHRPADNLAS
jgi:lysophospholipase L1-like esterase